MLTIDLIGLFVTILLIGLRYPHYVLMAAFIHEFSNILVGIFLHAKFDYIVAAGAFGTIAFENYNSHPIVNLIVFSGPLANYVTSAIVGGIAFESTGNLLNTLAYLKKPFAVVNFRLCVVSILVNIWNIFI